MAKYKLSKKEIIQKIIDKSEEIEFSMDSNKKRNTGSYYTSIELSYFMIKELFETLPEEFIADIENKTFLEPCVGMGSFVFAYLMVIDELELSKEKIKKILNNIYVCDINKKVIEEYKQLFIQFVYAFFDIELDTNYFKGRVASGLLFDMNYCNLKYIDIKDVFLNVMNRGGFDIVATNPPYKNLKVEKNKYKLETEYLRDKNLYEEISKMSTKIFKYSSEGIINLYKLFIEEIVCKYSSEDAKIALLIPNTILSDKTCKKLRTYIIENHQIASINIINENNNFVKAKQALCTMLLNKGKKTEIIKINNNFCEDRNKSMYMNIEDIIDRETGNAIFTLSEEEYQILNKIRKFPKIKELEFIINMRGEFDLTINKEFINNKNGFKLVRGRNIEFYKLNENKEIEYVDKKFVNLSNKKKYLKKERIACQQISNIHRERRINFTIIPKNYILGNSCNFISVENNNYGIDLYFVLGILNSKIINWYFKLTSSNNHINNYEIDTFPIPVESKYINQISKYVKKYLRDRDEKILEKVEDMIYESYGILNYNEKSNKLIKKYLKDINYILPQINIQMAKDIINSRVSINEVINMLNNNLLEFDKKVCNNITEKYKKINNNEVLNHMTFKLSDLDMEMIKSVPPGGNWQNIPMETVKKSQRLIKIVKTGGRTTLYGRIDYNKPSYTITTYFNRPGNGTYVHPNLDRVISVREASRLQSFSDDYYFCGNKTDLLKQVGNAVPPILAKEIGNSIINKTKCNKSIDLFCGAGGLTAGFKLAGIKSILGNDLNENACITFKTNNPEIQVLCDDITKRTVKDKIIEIAKQKKIDIICGGPPCQGFSYAGKRFIDDSRNQLFKDFIEIVRAVKPKIVVMENVEGMLTFDKGNVYKQIHELYESMGYKIKGKVLMASNYGVPQKRKRLIIISVRNDLEVSPEELFPKPTTPEEEEQITVYQAISDLEILECKEDAKYSNTKVSIYIDKLKKVYKNLLKSTNKEDISY